MNIILMLSIFIAVACAHLVSLAIALLITNTKWYMRLCKKTSKKMVEEFMEPEETEIEP